MSASVLAVAEHRRGNLRDVSYELVTAGRELADDLGGELHVAAINGNVERFAKSLDRTGVDVVHTVDAGAEYNHDVYVRAVEALFDDLDPTAVLMPHSVNGLDYAPAVANALSLPLVTDATDFSYDGGLVATHELYGSKLEATVEVDAERFAMTIREGAWPRAEGTATAEMRAFDVDVDEKRVGSQVVGFEEVGGSDVGEADVLVSVGRGIGSEENLELVERLADALDATLLATRAIVEKGWLPRTRQVGHSGKVVTPKVYVAVGVSGPPQHVAGVKAAETIVAINADPDAPIFDVADYGVVGDLFEVVPALIEEFER